MGPLLAVMSKSLGLRGKKGINSAQNSGEFDQVADLFVRTAIDALNKSGREFVKDIDIEEIVIPALRDAAKGIQIAGKDIDVALEEAITEIRTFGPVGVGSGSTGGKGRTDLLGSYKREAELGQEYAIRRNPEMFRKVERFSESKGKIQKYFETYNPSTKTFEPGQMSHLSKSVTASEQELIAMTAPYLKDAGPKITKAITKNIAKGVADTVNAASPAKETQKVVLPDGEHLINGTIYVVQGGEVVSTKEVTEQQEEVIEEVAEKAVETMTVHTEAKPEEQMSVHYEEPKPATEMEAVVPTPEAPAEDERVSKLESQMGEMVTEIATLRAMIETPAPVEDVEVQMSGSLWRSIAALRSKK
jgi:hypothetical protein